MRRRPRALDEGSAASTGSCGSSPSDARPSPGAMLPVVERIDPAMVPEIFWRHVASRPTSGNPRTISAYSPSHLIAHLAWYDREVAAALFEPTRERIEHAEDRELATWRAEFLAWSLFDPRAAVARLEKVPVSDDPDSNANAARIAVASSLGGPLRGALAEGLDDREIILGRARAGFLMRERPSSASRPRVLQHLDQLADELADLADDLGAGAVDRLGQAADDRAADDQAVGDRGELADLVRAADPEADADRQVGLGPQPADRLDQLRRQALALARDPGHRDVVDEPGRRPGDLDGAVARASSA